jgi:hypothetical protein
MASMEISFLRLYSNDTSTISISNTKIAKCLFLDSYLLALTFLIALFLELRGYHEYYPHFMACLIRARAMSHCIS